MWSQLFQASYKQIQTIKYFFNTLVSTLNHIPRVFYMVRFAAVGNPRAPPVIARSWRRIVPFHSDRFYTGQLL